MKNTITKALINADALDQKLSAALTQNGAMQTNIKRITCLDHAGREVSCAIVERQAHESAQILEKALADVERLEMQLRELLQQCSDAERADLILTAFK